MSSAFCVCKLCSTRVNQFNSCRTSQRLSSHCIQDSMNTERLSEEGGDVERWTDFKCGHRIGLINGRALE